MSSSALRDAGLVMITLRMQVTEILLHCNDFNAFKSKDDFVGLCARRTGRTRELAGAGEHPGGASMTLSSHPPAAVCVGSLGARTRPTPLLSPWVSQLHGEEATSPGSVGKRQREGVREDKSTSA